MPHGYQWSHEEYRNAERMAEIQARAIVEAQRKERERLERETRTTESRAPITEPTRTPPTRTTYNIFTLREAQREAKIACARLIAEIRAKNAMGATFGSAEYIHSRYGHVVWCGKITEYRNKFGCSEEEAIELIVRDYSESDWVHLEDPLIETFMGHRR